MLNAATRIVDADPNQHPYLTECVNRMHAKDRSRVSAEEFNALMLTLAPTSRPVDALRRSGWTVEELMFTLTEGDILDVRHASWHCWAIWYLTCEQFGVNPPWMAGMLRHRLFSDQLQYERERLRLPEPATRAKAGALR